MGQVTDKLHVEGCRCPDCIWGVTKPVIPAAAAGDTVAPAQAVRVSAPIGGASADGFGDELSATRQLAERTHRLVVIIAWIVIVQAVLAVGWGVIAGANAARAKSQVDCLLDGGSISRCVD